MKQTQTRTITDVEGVYASGLHCGIKSRRPDLAYIYVPECHSSAGVFTQNKFHAACVGYTRDLIGRKTLKAVVVNAGNANAATGDRGLADTRETGKLAARILGLDPDEVGVASTGIIGVALPMEKIRSGLDRLLVDPARNEGEAAAEAIRTTDTFAKHVFLERRIGGETVRVAGIAKGSGMIAPNMGTMLAFLATDARVDREPLHRALSEAVDATFNMVSVDTDTSTNDMALIFSTGRTPVDDEAAFAGLLTDACRELAKAIAADGEGATKLIEARVAGAASLDQARRIAKSIVESPLVKTAIHGADPNWGRVLVAAGKTPDVEIDPAGVSLALQGVEIFRGGEPVEEGVRVCAPLLQRDEVLIELRLGSGAHEATAWGCDLTHGYIDINTQYS